VKVDEHSVSTGPRSGPHQELRPVAPAARAIPAEPIVVPDDTPDPQLPTSDAATGVEVVGVDEVAEVVPSNRGRVATWWHSRLGYRLFCEIGLMYGVYFIYKIVRYEARGNVSAAFDNAQQVVHVERALGIFTEVDVQMWALRSTDLIRWLNRYYLVAHFTASMLCFIWLYARHPVGYAKCRRLLIGLTMLALVVHVAYPLAPPRMFSDLGFVDTARTFGPDTYGEGSQFKALANQFAAMPSLHFGWSVLVAYAAVRFSRSKLRFIVIAHPICTLAAIVLTANHFWLDAIVALVLLLLLFAVDPWVSRLRTILPVIGRRMDAAQGRVGSASGRMGSASGRIGPAAS
jgi:hypothetical protein